MNNFNRYSFYHSVIIAKFNFNKTFFVNYISIPTVQFLILRALHFLFLCHCTILQADVSAINRFHCQLLQQMQIPHLSGRAYSSSPTSLMRCDSVCVYGKRKWRQHSEGTSLMPFRCQWFPQQPHLMPRLPSPDWPSLVFRVGESSESVAHT